MNPDENLKHSSIDALLVNASDVAHLLKISTRTLWRMRSTGQLPLPVRLGGAVRWRLDEIQNWIAAGCPTGGSRKNGSQRNP